MKQLEEKVRYYVNRVRNYIFKHQTVKLREDLKKVLVNFKDKMPVLVISYNNGVYVENMVRQLKKFDIKPIIIDNKSTEDDSVKRLKSLESEAYVIYAEKNFGCFVGFLNPVYELLPKIFAYTDPDLILNENLPENFLEVLTDLTYEFNTYKAGFAMELLDEPMTSVKLEKFSGVPKINRKFYGVKVWETRHWRYKLEHKSLDIYHCPVDTTFCVCNKDMLVDDFYDGVRVSGDFGAIHMPWYPKRDIMKPEQKKAYLQGNNSTNWVG